MDKKITELNNIRNISKAEYIAVANDAETCKLKISDLQRAIVNVDDKLSNTSKNAIANNIVSNKFDGIISRLNELEKTTGRILDLQVGDVYTTTLETGEDAKVEISSTEISDSDDKKLVFKFFIPKGDKGEQGVQGEDGSYSEYIYKLFETEQVDLIAPESIQQDKYVPEGWSDHPTGVNEDYKYEYICLRYKDAVSKQWGNFSTPVIWSKYGIDGKDGDGVEYIYQITETSDSPRTPGKVPSADSPTTEYQDHEFLPQAAEGENPWTDNPTGVSDSFKYEWVSVRRFKFAEQAWGDFSTPALWAKYGEKGDTGSGVRILGSFSTYQQLLNAYNNQTLPGGYPPEMGDGYLVNGDLYVWDGDSWANVGNIKGPAGDKAYVHIKFADYLDSNGDGVFTANNGETPGKYIGMYADWTEADSTISSSYRPWVRFKGEDGFGYEYIYKRTTVDAGFVAPKVPDVSSIKDTVEYQTFGYVPEGWTDEPSGVDAAYAYEWCCYRKRGTDGVWTTFTGKSGGTYAWLHAMYAKVEIIPGDTGNPGPAIYPAGDWKIGTYVQTVSASGIVTATPYVVHKNKYYVLIVEQTSSEPGIGTDWLEMDKFNAVYAEILLADKANVGKACFYGDYMFSRGGTGNFEDYDYTKEPYADDQPFKPAWCVNLVTGEMWSGTNSTYFAADGSGRVANGEISWTKDGKVVLNTPSLNNGLSYTHNNAVYTFGPREQKYEGGIRISKPDNEGYPMFDICAYNTAAGETGSYTNWYYQNDMPTAEDYDVHYARVFMRPDYYLAQHHVVDQVGNIRELSLSATGGISFRDDLSMSGGKTTTYSGYTGIAKCGTTLLYFKNGILYNWDYADEE